MSVVLLKMVIQALESNKYHDRISSGKVISVPETAQITNATVSFIDVIFTFTTPPESSIKQWILRY